MLTKRDFHTHVLDILDCLQERGSRASSAYLYGMSKLSLDDFSIIIHVSKKVGFLTEETPHLLKITEKGSALVNKMRAPLQ